MNRLTQSVVTKMKRISIIVLVGMALLASSYVGFPIIFKRVDAENRTTVGMSIGKSVDGPIPGKPIEVIYKTVRLRPEIRTENSDVRVIFPPIEGEPIDLFCSPKYEPLWFKNMPKDRELEFTLWLTKEVTRHYENGKEDFFWYPEIETIKDGSNVIYDARICPLHETKMERGEIEIQYGLPMQEFMEAMHKEFYGGPGFTLGGCCVGPEKKMVGYRCPDCIAAYNKWSAGFEARIAAREKLAEEKK